MAVAVGDDDENDDAHNDYEDETKHNDNENGETMRMTGDGDDEADDEGTILRKVDFVTIESSERNKTNKTALIKE